jgi:PPOX class probable F420-dependent enzyme
VAPVWFDLDDDDTFVFTTGETSIKGRSILYDPRLALCVDDPTPPFAFVTIEGTAEISRDLADLMTWATRIGGRYMGAVRAPEFGERNAAAGELLVRVRAERTIGRTNIAE